MFVEVCGIVLERESGYMSSVISSSFEPGYVFWFIVLLKGSIRSV